MNRFRKITAAVLAGGAGTRLRPEVADRPKPLAPVHGRPFLLWLLDQLADAGLRRVVLCTGHMAEQVEQSLGCHYRDMELVYSPEHSPLGTGGALRQALPLLDRDPVLVCNGDSYFCADLGLFLQEHLRSGGLASLLLCEVDDVSRYGVVELAPDNTVAAFREKGSGGGAGLINAGLYLLDRRVIAAIPPHRAVSLERELFPTLVGQGLTGFRQSAPFIDIGTPSDYRRASRFFAALTSRSQET